MNGREAERRRCFPPSQPLSTSSFALAIARVAVAQICQGVGFRSAELSVLDSLSCIATTYMRHLGRSARHGAESSGRTECNLLDVVRALEDLASSHGFDGASDINRPLARSGALSAIIQFAAVSNEIPFAKRISPQCDPEGAGSSSFLQLGEKPPLAHVPSWLPAFPEEFRSKKGRKAPEVTVEDLSSLAVSVSKKRVESEFRRNFLPLERPLVRFEFGVCEKPLDECLDSVDGKQGNSWLDRILERRVKERLD
ncbi:Transcription initiation factor TFIID subunit 8 [Nymphaea thermarum]|nr:Transcription initiation factor TFIID subunit 8 [Nymphaea thermarum]